MASIYGWNAFVINLIAFIACHLLGVCGRLPRELDEHLILYYNFDHIKNGTVLDNSSHERNATMADHAHIKTEPGKCGNGIVLNTKPLTINTNSSTQSQNISYLELTIVTWIFLNESKKRGNGTKRAKRTIFTSFFSKTKDSPKDRLLYFAIFDDMQLRWSAFGDKFKVHGYKLKAGAWYHIAVNYKLINKSYEECIFFVNGSEVLTKVKEKKDKKTLKMVLPLGLTPYIGGSINGSEPLAGIVDDYYMFNKTLSETEIQQLMNDTCKTNDSTTATTSGAEHPEFTTSRAPPLHATTATSTIKSSREQVEKIISTSRAPPLHTTTVTTTQKSSGEQAEKIISTSRAPPLHTTTATTTQKSLREQPEKIISDYINSHLSVTEKSDESGSAISKTQDLEEYALTFASNLTVNQTVTFETPSALVVMKKPLSGFTFPHQEPGKMFNETISFPDEMVKTENGVTRAFVCIGYSKLHESMPENVTISSGSFKPNTTLQLSSKIIGAAVKPGLDKPLAKHIQVIFHHAEKLVGKKHCSFWNHSIRTANGTFGQWSTSGCHLDEKQSDTTKTVCLCNHLTNFALLLQREGVSYSDPPLSLKIITIVGCSLSILACLLCFIMFYTLKNKDIRHYLHINLTFAIAVAQVILIFGINQTEYEILCKAMASLLHYFYLVAFLLMLCEGVHLAILIETAFSHGDVKLPVYLISSWGLPLIIVGITLGARHDNYGGSTGCFISANQGTVYAFVAPFALILAINLVILIMVLRQVIKKTSLPISSKAASKFEIARATIRSLVILFPVMGFTWVFGILFFGFRTLALEYLFAIFCSLQGFFIFLFQYALNTESRSAFLRATKRLRLTLTSSTNGTKPTSQTKIKISSPSENDDGGQLYTSAQDNCNLTAYRHVDDKTTISTGATLDSRTGSTYI